MRIAAAVCFIMVAWTALSSCTSADPQNGISDSGTESLRGECVAGGMADLDAEIALFEKKAQARPELYIDVAERLYRKAEMYRLQITQLELKPERDHREEWQVMRARDETLERALGALEKIPGKVYSDTDVRMLKALVYVALQRVVEAMGQLEELAGDPEANPALRQQAGKWLSELRKGM